MQRPPHPADPRGSEGDGAAARSPYAFSEGFAIGDELLLSAAERAFDLGADSLPLSAASLLTALTTSAQPSSVLEIGTGAGVSSAAIARALDPAAALTLIDPDSEYLRAAKANIAAAGFPVHRVRSIAATAQEVLSRFSTSGYDFLFIDADPRDYREIAEASMRLVRPGGLLVVHNILADGTVQDPADRGDAAVSARQALEMLTADTRFTSSLVPVGEGMLVAAKKLRF